MVHIFELLCRDYNPHPVEDGDYMLTTSTETPDWLEPEGWWLRFLKHHPVTSPSTNQKNVHELITHPVTLTPNVAFKSPFLKIIKEFGSFEHEFPILLACRPTINSVLSFTTTQLSVDSHSGEWTQVCFGNTLGPSRHSYICTKPFPAHTFLPFLWIPVSVCCTFKYFDVKFFSVSLFFLYN